MESDCRATIMQDSRFATSGNTDSPEKLSSDHPQQKQPSAKAGKSVGGKSTDTSAESTKRTEEERRKKGEKNDSVSTSASLVQEKKRRPGHLTDEMRDFAAQEAAKWTSWRTIADLILERFGYRPENRTIKHFIDEKLTSGEYTKWHYMMLRLREKWVNDLADLPMAHKKERVSVLQQVIQECMEGVTRHDQKGRLFVQKNHQVAVAAAIAIRYEMEGQQVHVEGKVTTIDWAALTPEDRYKELNKRFSRILSDEIITEAEIMS